MMRMWIALAAMVLSPGFAAGSSITTGSLIDDMIDLDRLTRLPAPFYKSIQFSSHDRTSSRPGEEGWFANSDGSGVEAVLREPTDTRPGEYLLAEVEGPGAIVRMWTAEIPGTIRLFLDGSDRPVYSGPASQFIRRPYDAFLRDSGLDPEDLDGTFYQRDASYAPIPFAERCRIIWIGNASDVHFYHIQFHTYDPGTAVTTFTPDDVKTNADRMRRVAAILKDPRQLDASEDHETTSIDIRLEPGRRTGAPRLTGSGAIRRLTLKVDAEDRDLALRQTIMRIQFDNHPWGQVEAPVGDFFGAGPGVNPFESFPFTVTPGGTMTCRYPMPYAESARIIFENKGEQPVHITGSAASVSRPWDDTSMHFRARWRIDHDLLASNQPSQGVQDVPFFIVRGQGHYVGTAIMLLNPSEVPTSWGNWWGEGDEKIYVDGDTFPSIFGTGTEDYFNYSWSAFDIFGYPYCAQPRNDGPGNRGFIVNQRWHILDPLPFKHNLAFYIELASHYPTEGVSYGRISYLYTRPEAIDDHVTITKEDVRTPVLPQSWEPIAVFGSRGLVFYPCEDLVTGTDNITHETGGLWQGGRIMVWTPEREGETLTLSFNVSEAGDYPFSLYCMLRPGAGAFRAAINGDEVQLSGRDVVDLHTPHHVMSRSYGTQARGLNAGTNTVTLTATTAGKPIGLDFIGTRQ